MKRTAIRACLHVAVVAVVSGGRLMNTAIARASSRGHAPAQRQTNEANASAGRQTEEAAGWHAKLGHSLPVTHFAISAFIDRMMRGEQEFGDPRCPCIGLANIVGKTTVQVEGEAVEYPGDLGALCNPWDNGFHPKCEVSENARFCAERWCYVDPCNCDLPIPPKVSEYLPDGQFRGRPVHYSYSTCDSTDTWSRGHAKKATLDITALCSKEVDAKVWGNNDCQCIGIDGQPGENNVQFGDLIVAYPADLGATCEAWDKGRTPECTETDAPKWCSEKWCYVDPCSCNLEIQPRESTYLKGGMYQGRPLHYSYTTCGGVDNLTRKPGEKECISMKSKILCEGNEEERCEWDHDLSHCIPADLHNLCKGGTAGPTGASALVLAALGGALRVLLA